jgi:hypothetical protein
MDSTARIGAGDIAGNATGQFNVADLNARNPTEIYLQWYSHPQFLCWRRIQRHARKEQNMANAPFGSDDLGTINQVLRHHPRAADLIRLVRRIATSATYPITSFTALSDALGGDEATISFGGRDWPLAELRRMIPAYYFPIASEDDLVAKLVELGRERRRRWMRHGPEARMHKVMRHRGWGPPPWEAAWPAPPPPRFFMHRRFGPPPSGRPE